MKDNFLHLEDFLNKYKYVKNTNIWLQKVST